MSNQPSCENNSTILYRSALTVDFVGYSRGSACLLSLLCCVAPCIPVFVLRKKTREIHNHRGDSARKIDHIGNFREILRIVLHSNVIVT